MLKRDYGEYPSSRERPAAFGRLCVETESHFQADGVFEQPPSGGCVLKQIFNLLQAVALRPAAFGRLCVETPSSDNIKSSAVQPPSGGCVLKRDSRFPISDGLSSRLRAAVC